MHTFIDTFQRIPGWVLDRPMVGFGAALAMVTLGTAVAWEVRRARRVTRRVTRDGGW